MRPVQVFSRRDFATIFTGIDHVEMSTMCTLYMKLYSLGATENFATNTASILRAHVVRDKFLQSGESF